MLVILDGFGYRKAIIGNAIAAAKMPFFTSTWVRYAHALLQASGIFVGLPNGYIGNSEVGHTTIGAGRICKQSMTIINDVIAQHALHKNEPLRELCKKVVSENRRLHLIGIISDGGVHGHIDHLLAYIKTAYSLGVHSIIVHAILDGRDSLPFSATTYLAQLDEIIKKYSGVQIGSIHGRFYAMDRDRNEERTEKSIIVLTEKTPVLFSSWQEVLDDAYKKNITDEFIQPEALISDGYIQKGDGILCTNIRPDRMRQLTSVLCHKQKKIAFQELATAVPYVEKSCTKALFYPIHPQVTLKDVLNEYHKRIYTIAETEKYAHVTYFFDGGKEVIFPYETRVLIPSLKREKYDTDPEMSAQKITNMLKYSLQTDMHDFYLVNYANADMVAHSGNFLATVKAVEFLDTQLAVLYQEVVQKRNGILCITADHGNAEEMIDMYTGLSKTSHTTNPVPFLMICNNKWCEPKNIPLYQLADIAPFLLKCMGLSIPGSMKSCC